MQNKLELLKKKLAAYDRLAIAYSGGVDSTFLLLCAKEVLGNSALAVTAVAPNFPPDETKYAEKFCEEHEIPQLVVNIGDELMTVFADNLPERCYLCKSYVFGEIANSLEDMPIADGTNIDDLSDYRPGRMALKELGIISPLEEAGFTKKDVRMALKAMNIDIWDKPACACLASRIPYGETITPKKLAAVYEVESKIKKLGFKQIRLRHHGNLARLEVSQEEMPLLYNPKIMDSINKIIKNAGFTYATLDLGGYQMGSLNKEL